MIAAHLFDAWTLETERARSAYRWTIALGGLGAPLFLFLAGLTFGLTAVGRERRGVPTADVAARGRRRGWQIFGLAFLFRLQSLLVSGGSFPSALFKVDILNVMGLAMVAGATVWGVVRTFRRRILVCAGATIAVILLGPVTRGAEAITLIPPPLLWYLQPVPGKSSFTLAPWTAFFFAGMAAGLLYAWAAEHRREPQLIATLSAIGAATAVGGYVALYGPPILGASSLSGSPASMALRLGLVLCLLGLAYCWTLYRPGPSRLAELGVASLFVYWIHVEMVYGTPSRPIHRGLTYEQGLLGYVAFCALMFAAVALRNRLPPDWTRSRWRLGWPGLSSKAPAAR
jgi:uncharacterized membrane protein